MSKDKKTTENVTEAVPLTEEQCIQIMVAQMNERYQAWHHIRDRSTQFTLWILGLAVAASWWLLQEPSGNLPQKVAVTILVLLLGGAALYLLKSLARGVSESRKILINIETALGLHSRGTILPDNTILPPEYKETRPRPNAHFCTLYVLLLVISIYLLTAIWNPFSLSPGQSQGKVGAPYPYQNTEQAVSDSTMTHTTVMPVTKGDTK